MESRSCKNSRRRNCGTPALPSTSPCFCLTTVKPMPLMNSLTLPIPASFSPKRKNFCRKRCRNNLVPHPQRRHLRRRSRLRPPIPHRVNRVAFCRLFVFSEKPLRRRSVSTLYSFGIKGKRRERGASGVYFYGAINFQCSTSSAVVVGRAQRIAQIEVKQTSRNGSRILSANLCLVSGRNFA